MASKSDKVYQYVTERVLALLDKGVIPWAKPWKAADTPKSGSTGKAYRGINALMLYAQQEDRGFKCPYWFTRKQIMGCKGRIKKGERSCMVVFWKRWNVVDKDGTPVIDDKTGDQKVTWMTRYYNVWNQAQFVEGPQLPKGWDDEQPAGAEPIEVADTIKAGYMDGDNAPGLKFESGRAFYQPAGDFVNMPQADTFHSSEGFYAVLFHELGHSTGHESRLARSGITDSVKYRGHEYAQEEIVADMCAAFVMGTCGLAEPIIENTAAYIETWRSRISDDPKLVVMAAQRAQKAADLITGDTITN